MHLSLYREREFASSFSMAEYCEHSCCLCLQLAFVFESKNSSFNSDISSLQAANSDLTSKIASLHGEINEETGRPETPLEKARSRNQALVDDTEKFEKVGTCCVDMCM